MYVMYLSRFGFPRSRPQDRDLSASNLLEKQSQKQECGEWEKEEKETNKGWV